MEVVLILIAVGILGYIFYQSLPNPKFQKACSLFDSGNLSGAEKILIAVFEKHPDAPAKIAECKLTEGKQLKSKSENDAIRLFNEAIEIKKRLPSNAAKDKYELIEAKSYFEIAEIKYINFVAVTDAEIKAKNLKDNLRFIEAATKNGIEKEFSDLRKKHLSELAEINFSFGMHSEKSNKLVDAIKHYGIAKDFATQSSNSTILYSSSTRTGISKLKNKELIEQTIFDDVNKAAIELKRDFYFRYAKKLLADKEFQQSEKIISTHLNFASPVVDKLRELLRAKKIKDAVKKVNEINFNLDQLYENSFPVDDVKTLYDSLDKRIDEIKTVIPTITEKIRELKPSLFNRLLTHYIDEEQFGNAIVLIQKYPAFWESPELLKDLGICCYGYTSQGNLSEKNYRTVISNWLTSVFCDKVILKSMEETSWDDAYTFTLAEAIGSNYQQHDGLPDNVNYDDPTDSNISIGATQKELLHQFETMLHDKISDHNFLKTVTDFYDSEKEAIQNIVQVIDSDVLFPSPYFAKSYGIHDEIIDALDSDYESYSNEGALQAGIPYVKSASSGAVGKYATAKELISKLLSAIENENLSSVKSIVADKQKSVIEEFESISDSVEDSIYNAFAIRIKEDDENEDLIPIMNECIKFTNENEKLKFQYSNYVASLCIAKVNADDMSNYQALSLMKSAYMYSKDNSRICKNIITLIRYNLSDYLNDDCRNVNDMFSILDTLRKNRSSTFNENNMELRNELKTLDDALKAKGSSVATLLSKHITELSDHGTKLQKIAKTYLELIK